MKARKTARREDRWEPLIQRFEQKDRASPPRPGGAVFIGSSNFARWSQLEGDFREFGAINRAFGGSWLMDVARYVDRIVVPHAPAKVVLYGGPNELSEGETVEATFRSWEGLVGLVRARLPSAPIYTVSLKPSPLRMNVDPAFKAFNRLLKERSEADPSIRYVDIVPVFTRADGTLRGELYAGDGVHMNRAGEQACTPVLRDALKR